MGYLELRDLYKSYDKKENMVVKGINLSIQKGEFIVLLGPSGCGKTTTIRMISGLEEVTQGDIILDNESIVNKATKDREISMVFQSYAIWPHMTVYENIAYPLRLRKLSKAMIDQIVNEVAEISHIKEYLKRYPAQLSGGQKQRVAVARAIAIKPKIFLMDEPLSNLDAKLRVSVRTELREIHNQLEATTIFVTHDQSEAMSLADRIVVMKDGVIEQIGTPDEVYHQSDSMFVASFIGSPPTNFFDADVKQDESGIHVVACGFRKTIKDDKLIEALRPYANDKIVLGIRPEKFEVNTKPKKDSFECTVEIIEPQGSHTVAMARVHDTSFKFLYTEHLNIKPLSKVYLNFKIEEIMIFNQQTGRRIPYEPTLHF